MRFVTFSISGPAQDSRPAHTGSTLGVLSSDGEEIYAISAGTSLLQALGSNRLTELGTKARSTPAAVYPVSAVQLLAPLERPPSIRDFMAFEQHVDGVSRRMNGKPTVPESWYAQPLHYFSNPTSVHGPYQDVAVPPGCGQFDFELEVAAVLGASGSNLTLDEAERAIAGYLIFNDWSARDLQSREMMPLGPCKGKDSAITIGPWFVTPDELQSRRSGTAFDLQMTVSVNGDVVGTDRLDSMSWSFAEMVSYASRGSTVSAGDMFGSGTCGDGCLAEGWGRHGPQWRPSLQPGDLVEMTVDQLGRQASRIVAGAPIRQPLIRRTAKYPPTIG